MDAAPSSIQPTTAKQFSNMNHHSKKGEHRDSFQSAQKVPRHLAAQNSTRGDSSARKSPDNRNAGGAEKRGNVANSASNAESNQSGNAAKKVFQWCAQCWGRKKSMIGKHRRKKQNCFKRLREKYRKRKTAKRASFKTESGVMTEHEDDSPKRRGRSGLREKHAEGDDKLREKDRREGTERGRDVTRDRGVVKVERPKQGKERRERAIRDEGVDKVERPKQGKERRERAIRDEGVDKVERPKQGKERRERAIRDEGVDKLGYSRQSKKRRGSIARALSDAFLRMSETDLSEETDECLEPEIDFTKSCCYMCAKNTMAIVAAMSNKVGKMDISIQTCTKEEFTSDKGCSPSIKFRTIQSSVRVKTRDMGTWRSDGKKSKRVKSKLKFNKLNIFPKLKKGLTPKVRTVACETEKPIRCKNIAQCKARQAAQCVRETNMQ